MGAGETQPTQPLPADWAYAEPPRRRVWPWLVAFGIVVVLAVVAWFAGDAVAREVVTHTVRQQVITQLSLPADQQIDVDIDGPVIPQLIMGRIGDISISSEDVPIGGFEGDVTVSAQGVPIRGGGEMTAGSATIVLDEDQLRSLMSAVDGFPAETLGLDDPDVTMATELQVFGAAFDVGVSLTPSAVDGDLVLSPSSLQLAGADITADRLRDQFGVVADLALRAWTVCIADSIPAGVTLTTVTVVDDQLVGGFALQGGIISVPALQQKGTCDEA